MGSKLVTSLKTEFKTPSKASEMMVYNYHKLYTYIDK